MIGPTGRQDDAFKMITGEDELPTAESHGGDTVRWPTSIDPRRPMTEHYVRGDHGRHGLHLNRQAGDPGRRTSPASTSRGRDQQKPVGELSGGERNPIHLAKLRESGVTSCCWTNPPTTSMSTRCGRWRTGLRELPGCADRHRSRPVVPGPHRHARPGVRGDSQVRWFEGNFTEYEEWRRKQLGAAADQPPDQVQEARVAVGAKSGAGRRASASEPSAVGVWGRSPRKNLPPLRINHTGSSTRSWPDPRVFRWPEGLRTGAGVGKPRTDSVRHRMAAPSDETEPDAEPDVDAMFAETDVELAVRLATQAGIGLLEVRRRLVQVGARPWRVMDGGAARANGSCSILGIATARPAVVCEEGLKTVVASPTTGSGSSIRSTAPTSSVGPAAPTRPSTSRSGSGALVAGAGVAAGARDVVPTDPPPDLPPSPRERPRLVTSRNGLRTPARDRQRPRREPVQLARPTQAMAVVSGQADIYAARWWHVPVGHRPRPPPWRPPLGSTSAGSTVRRSSTTPPDPWLPDFCSAAVPGSLGPVLKALWGDSAGPAPLRGLKSTS